ncbi:MAG: 30S ribosomal protein S16 [Polyangiaceae bacterium]|nr:30S ribosomal protein S16 [Polyangiaceae bacterium]
MAVHIRLSRSGTSKRPFYKVLATDHRSPRGGRFLEKLGTFDPREPVEKGTEPMIKVDMDRLNHWVSEGAQLSATVDKLLKKRSKVEAKAAK